MIDTEFDAWFARHRRDAVLLYRPYPPHTAPRTNSKFGGLPRLPEHYEWPRDANGAALHFLAQVDCADIGFATALPERGVLFFFGREDGDQVWNDDSGAYRVIYALDAFAATPPRAHPSDLGPVGGGYYPALAWRDFVAKQEAGPAVHIEWPVQPLRIDSWPDTLFEGPEEEPQSWIAKLRERLTSPPAESWQEESARFDRYADQHRELRVRAFAEATGQKFGDAVEEIAREHRAAKVLFLHADNGPEAYPQHWLTVSYAARAVVRLLKDDEHFAVRFDPEVAAAASSWVARAARGGHGELVGDADAQEFREWLGDLSKRQPGEAIGVNALPFVHSSLNATIREWAADPAKAARISPDVYEALRYHMVGNSGLGLAYSQMLGHAPSAQEPLHPDDPTVVLLNLASDWAQGWMFGDVGNCTFTIPAADLARRNFSKVEAEVVGH